MTRLALTGVGLFCLTLVAVTGWSALWPDPDMEDIAQADVILCLAAGLTSDGRMGPHTRARARRCVDLFHAGKAPLIAFTGGNTTHDAPPTGQQMADFARALGVPAQAMLAETASESTLQNALLTQPLLPDHIDSALLVTDPFHLPRSWVSFRWAGYSAVSLIAPDNSHRIRPNIWLLQREALAIWANALRVPAYGLSGALGLAPQTRLALLK
jgi:vancomycin permeability regulator SanA